MKHTILFSLLFFPGLLFAQKSSFTLKGKVGTYKAPAKVFLLYTANDANVTDSAVLDNGAFSFSGTVAEPVQAVMVLDTEGIGIANINPESKPDVLRFYLESGALSLSTKDSLSKAVVNSKTNAENAKLNALLDPLQQRFRAVNAEYAAASPEKKASPEFMESLNKRFEALGEEQSVLMRDFIKANPGSYVNIAVLRSMAGNAADAAQLEPLINSLSPEVKSSASLKPILGALEAAKKTAVGAMAMDFTQNDPDGKPVKLSDFRGKYVLLDFWASWCGPCRQENPNVVTAYNKYKEKNFTVLGVSLDRPNGKDAWLKAVKDDGLEWTQVSDLKFWKNEVAVMYGIRSIPQNFLIDPQGKIIAVNLRGAALQERLAEVLK